MKFNNLLNKLKNGKTFEQVVVRYYKNKYDECCNVECIENEVYDDEDLYSFLGELGAEIENYIDGYAIIKTDKGMIYKVPCEDRENRFDDDLPNETILFFDVENIEEVNLKNIIIELSNCNKYQNFNEYKDLIVFTLGVEYLNYDSDLDMDIESDFSEVIVFVEKDWLFDLMIEDGIENPRLYLQEEYTSDDSYYWFEEASTEYKIVAIDFN